MARREIEYDEQVEEFMAWTPELKGHVLPIEKMLVQFKAELRQTVQKFADGSETGRALMRETDEMHGHVWITATNRLVTCFSVMIDVNGDLGYELPLEVLRAHLRKRPEGG